MYILSVSVRTIPQLTYVQSDYVKKWNGDLIDLDGIFGDETVEALQLFLIANGHLKEFSLQIDDGFGRESTRALQTFLTLNVEGYPLKKYGLDGVWRNETTVALQKYLNSFKLSFPIPVDGHRGVLTIALLQLFLNRLCCRGHGKGGKSRRDKGKMRGRGRGRGMIRRRGRGRPRGRGFGRTLVYRPSSRRGGRGRGGRGQ